MILIFNLELVPDMNHDLISTKELVLETSHDPILNLYFGIAPRARSWSWNMLRNISFVDHSLSLIISKQRVLSHMPPYTYLGSTTLLFVVRLPSRMPRTQRWEENLAHLSWAQLLDGMVLHWLRHTFSLTLLCRTICLLSIEDSEYASVYRQSGSQGA